MAATQMTASRLLAPTASTGISSTRRASRPARAVRVFASAQVQIVISYNVKFWQPYGRNETLIRLDQFRYFPNVLETALLLYECSSPKASTCVINTV